MINKFFFLIGRGFIGHLFLVLFAVLLATVLELIGIGLIPAFISFIINPEILLSKLPNFLENKVLFIKEIDRIDLLIYFSIIFFLFYLLKNMMIIFVNILEASFVYKVKTYNSQKLYRYYLDLSILFHANTNPAKLIRNLRIGVSHVAQLLTSVISFLKEAILLLILLVLLVFVDYKITLISFLILSATLLIYINLIKKKLHEKGFIEKQTNIKLFQLVNQALGSIKDSKILGIKNYLLNQYNKNLTQNEKNVFFITVLNKIPRLLLEQVTITLILLISVYLFLLEVPPVEVIPILSLFSVAAIRMMPAFTTISLAVSGYKYRKPSLDLIYSEFKKIEKLKFDKQISENISFKNDISLKDVSFKYQGRKKKILNNINIRLEKGKMISIIGKSGSGKTTLINIILGLIKPSSGDILIDNKKKILFNNFWYKKIGYVAQDIYLSDDTLKNNILFGRKNNKMNNLKIKKLIKLLNLENMVNNFDQGINTMVGDRGVRISGGERQRIGIARALYNNPEIIIFDEATASLDIELEQEVIKKIKKEYKNSTIISVSHRKVPIMFSDKIYKIEKSKISRIEKNKILK
jgi:ATP-binding cassette, subfamily B, bacterial PglK